MRAINFILPSLVLVGCQANYLEFKVPPTITSFSSLEYIDGNYSGALKNGYPNGVGVFRGIGYTAKGDFINGKLHGLGEEYDAQTDCTTKGVFVLGIGSQINMTCPKTNEEYIGETKRGKRHGWGRNYKSISDGNLQFSVISKFDNNSLSGPTLRVDSAGMPLSYEYLNSPQKKVKLVSTISVCYSGNFIKGQPRKPLLCEKNINGESVDSTSPNAYKEIKERLSKELTKSFKDDLSKFYERELSEIKAELNELNLKRNNLLVSGSPDSVQEILVINNNLSDIEVRIAYLSGKKSIYDERSKSYAEYSPSDYYSNQIKSLVERITLLQRASVIKKFVSECTLESFKLEHPCLCSAILYEKVESDRKSCEDAFAFADIK